MFYCFIVLPTLETWGEALLGSDLDHERPLRVPFLLRGEPGSAAAGPAS